MDFLGKEAQGMAGFFNRHKAEQDLASPFRDGEPVIDSFVRDAQSLGDESTDITNTVIEPAASERKGGWKGDGRNAAYEVVGEFVARHSRHSK